MIIGKDNNINFNNRLNTIKQNNNNNNNKTSINQNHQIEIMQHSNVMSKNEMADKSFSMLQERLRNGTISIEEFNKKCIQLGKQSKK